MLSRFFGWLRRICCKRPKPAIIVSSFSRRVFLANELPNRRNAVFDRCKIICPLGTADLIFNSDVPRFFNECHFMLDSDDPGYQRMLAIITDSR